jgi:NAD(P)-dependent dehydrogenase (short-subunit alcohol dehydrogenase family)
MSDRFTGRKLVVTGGSSGMGLATAATVVAEGGSVVLLGRNQAKLDEAVQTLGGGANVATIAGDLNDPAQVESIVQAIERDHADTSMLVNSAGFFIPKSFLEYDLSDYDSYLDINRGTFFLTQGVAKVMGSPSPRCDPVLGVLYGQGWPALLDAQSGHRARG